MELIEKELSSGILVRLRPVPPYVTGDVHRLLPEPPFPKVKVESRAGTEEHPALPGTPEWDKYQIDLAEHRLTLRQAVFDFTLQYGIVEWKLPDSVEWALTPPKDWEVPEIVRRYGLIGPSKYPFDDQRLRFIKYEVVLTSDDADLIDEVLLAETSPTTQEEVRSSLAPFESETPKGDQ